MIAAIKIRIRPPVAIAAKPAIRGYCADKPRIFNTAKAFVILVQNIKPNK